MVYSICKPDMRVYDTTCVGDCLVDCISPLKYEWKDYNDRNFEYNGRDQ
ncbi:MAG: hypothetical protein ISR95_00855 [Candidatus Marinimicrobia bacterium]|nr:hypothetical protein [Candidatus Neomarinimicrobiota bacterium]